MGNRFMRIDILTIFPNMFKAVLGDSIIKRARGKKIVKINVVDLRLFSKGKHRKVDDKPFGGGPGMVMYPEPFFEAVGHLKGKCKKLKTKIILLTPQGVVFNHDLAEKISKYEHVILLCGHYEGVDERVRQYLVDEEISIGDFVLTGGEIPAMALVDAVVRLMPGALGNEDSRHQDSFSKGLLEYPQYTRPADYKGMKVPEILLSGNHERIKKWREKESLRITKNKRPDLYENRERKL
jgi:tRNA (guanine37-N1)-methyltransferase